ncbi:MAG TPA: hypothetical protein VFS33_11685 [Gemmatimonadales bacterium]|nr:hypothetical protein [Gemmatimonadales bacterium]
MLAIVALVVIGGIVAGTMFVSTAEQRTSYNGLAVSQAFEAADAGLQATIANWDPSVNNTAVGAIASTGSGNFTSTSGASYVDTVFRLNNEIFLIKAVGTQGNASQTLAGLMKLFVVNPNVSAAVTAGGNVSVSGSAQVRGANTPPPGWSCPPGGSDMAGVRASGTVRGGSRITGSPSSVSNDPTVSSSIFEGPFNQLKQQATLRFNGSSGPFHPAPTAISGSSPARCDKDNPNNWGEPRRPDTSNGCAGYAPIILITGDAQFNGTGRGQGILLVDGDLHINGGFEWVGLIIATGLVDNGGGNSTITGALMSQNADLGDITINGNPTVTYSQCALTYVLTASALARPIAMRPWGQMF